MSDKLSGRFAKAHWVQFEDGRHFCEAPVTARGVPHNLTPGVHKCLDDYIDALETLRNHTGRIDSGTVDSLMCLSFGPWSQALAPVIEATADLSMRQCVRDPSIMSIQSGKAYLPDSTSDADAIVREPLFRRPCQASISDNPFATSYEHIDSFFNLTNSLVLVARCAAMECPHGTTQPVTELLCERIDKWINGENIAGEDPVVVRNAALCADALLMLSMMYPQKFGIGEGVVLTVWAEAVPTMHTKLLEQKVAGEPQVGALFGDLGLPEALVEQGRAWWKAFVRPDTGVWRGGPLGKLLMVLDKHDGSHKVSTDAYATVRDCLEQSVQAAWLVASPDGCTPPDEPHPCCEVSEPKRVRRPVIDPVFVGNEKRGIRQRGCLVGIKPHQLRQVCVEAMGAHLPDVVCQVSRNEGACLL